MPTNVPQQHETAEPFAPSPVYVQVGDLVVDEETGEVQEWPLDAPADGEGRLAWLMAQHAEATEQAKRWDATKRTYGHAVSALLGDRKSIALGAYRSRRVSGAQLRAAKVARLYELREAKVITQETVDVVLERAARDLDPKVLDALVDEEVITPEVRGLLVEVSWRAGYTLTEAVTKIAPAVSRKAASDD